MYNPVDYAAGDIVSYLAFYWTADNAVQGSETNIEFNSFVNYDCK